MHRPLLLLALLLVALPPTLAEPQLRQPALFDCDWTHGNGISVHVCQKIEGICILHPATGAPPWHAYFDAVLPTSSAGSARLACDGQATVLVSMQPSAPAPLGATVGTSLLGEGFGGPRPPDATGATSPNACAADGYLASCSMTHAVTWGLGKNIDGAPAGPVVTVCAPLQTTAVFVPQPRPLGPLTLDLDVCGRVPVVVAV